MTNTELRPLLRRIAIAYLFLHLNVHIGINGWPIQLLPNLVGWVLLYHDLPALAKAKRSIGLLRPFALVLGVWSLRQLLPDFDLPRALGIVSLVFGLLILYFHFQFLTDLAAILQERLPEGSPQPRRLLKCRNGFVVILTAMDLIPLIPDPPDWLAMLLLLHLLICVIVLLVTLWGLGKHLPADLLSAEEITEQ